MKQYKLLELTTQYDKYLSVFYNQHKNVENLSYDELFSELVEDAFAESDFIHRELNKMGIESKVIFCNNRSLQDKYKKIKGEISYFDILLAQIRDYMPDVIWISDMCYFSLEETKVIKACLIPKKIKLVGFHFTVLSNAFRQRATLYDQIYTGNKAFLNLMKEDGLPVYLLRHAFEPSVLDHVAVKEKKNEICFLGSIIIGENMHNNRIEMLCELIKEKIPYIFYGNIYGSVHEIVQKSGDRETMYTMTEIIKNMEPGVFGINYYTVMNQYSICLNLHALCSDNYGAGNMRMFEATGMGTCLLTDNKSENTELFDTDREIVVYESFDDMVQKSRWLIENPEMGRKIAAAGQRKTLKKYTYRNKAECLNEYIQMLLI